MPEVFELLGMKDLVINPEDFERKHFTVDIEIDPATYEHEEGYVCSDYNYAYFKGKAISSGACIDFKFKDSGGYWIALGDIKTEHDLHRTLNHLMKKNWMNPERIGALLYFMKKINFIGYDSNIFKSKQRDDNETV